MAQLDYLSDNKEANESLIDQILIRPSNPDDYPYIYSTWLKWYKHYAYFTKKIRNQVFYEWHHRIVDAILEDPETKILCTCFKDEPQILLGYFVWKPGGALHFAFVKREFVQQGLFRAMLKEAEVDLSQRNLFTHWTFSMDWMTQKYPELDYVPYLAF